jgi:hypothetical protein
MAESVDLAFVIDCTGSMSSYIDAVKRNVKSIVQRVVSTNGNLSLRLAVVGYRDIGDGAKRFEVLDFVPSVTEFENFVGRLVATGGADAPEDIAGAIQQANKLSWQQASRIVFLRADAPCHGNEFHSYSDDYGAGTPGIDILNELKRLQSKNDIGTMTLNFGKITNSTDRMIQVFAERGIVFDVVDLADVSKMTKSVTATVRKSIFKTMTVSGAGKKSLSFAPVLDATSLLTGKSFSSSVSSLKPYRVCSTRASGVYWETLPIEAVRVFRNKPVTSMNDLKQPLLFGLIKWKRVVTDTTMECTMWMRRASDPFAEGEIRLAYYGQIARRKKSLATRRTLSL